MLNVAMLCHAVLATIPSTHDYTEFAPLPTV